MLTIKKCLSLKQPYADMVVEGTKSIELRKWNTKHRGQFLVHASKTPFEDHYDKTRLGCIIGMATLVDVKHYETEEEWEKDLQLHRAEDDFIDSHYGFILKDPIKFDKPIPFAGQLNFFSVMFDSETNTYKQFIAQEKLF